MIPFLAALGGALRGYPLIAQNRSLLVAVQVRRSRAFGDYVIVLTWSGQDAALEEVLDQLFEPSAI